MYKITVTYTDNSTEVFEAIEWLRSTYSLDLYFGPEKNGAIIRQVSISHSAIRRIDIVNPKEDENGD